MKTIEDGEEDEWQEGSMLLTNCRIRITYVRYFMQQQRETSFKELKMKLKGHFKAL